jgi:hypothetical protein
MRKVFLAVLICFTPLPALTDNHEARVVELYQCELKEGKEMDAVKANNTRWLAYTRKAAGTDDVRSYALTPMVGDLTHFMFADSYPDLAAWQKVKSALETDEGQAIEDVFNELLECTKNRLYKSEQH